MENTKTAEEILNNVSTDTTTKGRVKFVDAIMAMEEYASPLKKRIEELEAASRQVLRFKTSLDFTIEKEFQYPQSCKSALNKLEELLNPSANGK